MKIDFEDDIATCSKKDDISNLLKELGLPRTSGGFTDCVDAVSMALETEEIYGSLTKVIIPEIAKKRGKSESAVEKAVRDAVSKGWSFGNREKFRAVFGDNYRPRRGRPTVTEFLAAAKDYLENAG